MPKYYVDAGDLRKIISSPNPTDAVITAFKSLETNPVNTLNSITIVSEEGFDSCNNDDLCYLTLEMLEQSDQLGYYQTED